MPWPRLWFHEILTFSAPDCTPTNCFHFQLSLWLGLSMHSVAPLRIASATSRSSSPPVKLEEADKEKLLNELRTELMKETHSVIHLLGEFFFVRMNALILYLSRNRYSPDLYHVSRLCSSACRLDSSSSRLLSSSTFLLSNGRRRMDRSAPSASRIG